MAAMRAKIRADIEAARAELAHLKEMGEQVRVIVEDEEQTAVFSKSLKGMNQWQMGNHLSRLRERIFTTKKRIVINAPRKEWGDELELVRLYQALTLKKRAHALGFGVSLKYDAMHMHLGSVAITVPYTEEGIRESNLLICAFEDMKDVHAKLVTALQRLGRSEKGAQATATDIIADEQARRLAIELTKDDSLESL